MSLPAYAAQIFGDLNEDGATCTTIVQSGDASSDSGHCIDIDKLSLALSGLSLSVSENEEVSKTNPKIIKVVILTPDSKSNAKLYILTLLIFALFPPSSVIYPCWI